MKIFEIGVMKTGTSSLGCAFIKLKFKHRTWDPKLYDCYLNNNYEPIYNAIYKYDSFDDGPWHDIDFRILDKKYPDSKFIILERDDASWIKSLEYHTSPKYNVNKIKDQYLNYDWINNRDLVIKEKIEWKNNKYKLIKQYFKDRPDDLLVMNIKDGWEPICNFLKIPIPNIDFPFVNNSILKI